MTSLGRFLVAAVALGGCRTRPYDVDGSAPPARDATIEPARDLAVADLSVGDDAAPIDCQAQLAGANLVKSSPGCILIESVSAGRAQLRYPCAGGAATATFGNDTFTGTVVAGQVDLAFHTPFPWQDGCKWETHQTIRGALASAKLAFVYEENPLAGETGCLPACSGTADVLVH